MKKLMVTLLACVLLSGCATAINKTMDSWMGANVNDLIASWGPPQQTMPDEQGGQILIYSADRTFTTPGQVVTNTNGQANAYGNFNANRYGNQVYGNAYGHAYGNSQSVTTYMPPQTSGYTAQRLFWVDSNGRIYKWSWKGV